MTLKDIIDNLNYELIVCSNPEEIEIKNAYTSDLLSDVMANASQESMIISIMAHKNTVAVAVMIDSPAIIICNNKEIPRDMIDAAIKENIAIIRTKDNQFITSYKIHKLIFG